MKTASKIENSIIADMMEVPQMKRGIVWCTKCGNSQKVDSAACMRHGWPVCCGYTMTIDSPKEREALRNK